MDYWKKEFYTVFYTGPGDDATEFLLNENDGFMKAILNAAGHLPIVNKCFYIRIHREIITHDRSIRRWRISAEPNGSDYVETDMKMAVVTPGQNTKSAVKTK